MLPDRTDQGRLSPLPKPLRREHDLAMGRVVSKVEVNELRAAGVAYLAKRAMAETGNISRIRAAVDNLDPDSSELTALILSTAVVTMTEIITETGRR